MFMYNCHCVECRAFSGASFATNAAIKGADFSIQDPGSKLSQYQTKLGNRYFCGGCGSPIYSCAKGNEDFPSLHCGSITRFPDKTLDANLWVSEKCPWVEVDENLKNYQRMLE